MAPTAATAIAGAVRTWLDGLDDDQRARASFAFDDAERFVWAYTPEPPREGLAIGEMRVEQQAAAGAIIAAAMSGRASREVGSIVALEMVLGALERDAGDPGWQRRDPGRYWFAVFGEPGTAAPWSWRLGGHHVAIHVTVSDGEVVGTTPSFLGANPAVVPAGPARGGRTLPGEEDLARATLRSLTGPERRRAIVSPSAPADILGGTGRHADVRSVPVGVRYAELGRPGRDALERLVRHYVGRSRDDVAEAAWNRVVAPELGDVSFAWSGSDVPGRGHYYAVRGPSFVIEYDNTQNGANHVHAVWRELGNDWGEDLLARHVAVAHREGA